MYFRDFNVGEKLCYVASTGERLYFHVTDKTDAVIFVTDTNGETCHFYHHWLDLTAEKITDEEWIQKVLES